MDAQSIKRVRLVNRLALILSATVLPYSIVFLCLGLVSQSIALAICLVVYVFVLQLNKQHHYLLSSLLIMASANACCLYFALSLGAASGVYFVFFFFAILGWLVFSVREWPYALAITLLSVAMFYYIIFIPYTPGIVLSGALTKFFSASASGVAFILLISTVVSFRNDSSRSELFLASTNNILQETKIKLQQTLTENDAMVAFAQTMYSNGSNIEQLCKAGIAKINDLIPYTYAALLLYDADTDTLCVQEEVGFNGGAQRAPSFLSSESLTGDAFTRQKTLRIKDTPVRYWDASSALGNARPAELVILPMTFKAKAGVLELAFMKPVEEATINLLQRISEAFAANILAIKSNDENTALVAALKNQKNELSLNYSELEQLREKANVRTAEQYESQQTLIKQIIEKGRQKEQELSLQINELKKQIHT
jgi:hypothetical protein